MFAALLFAPQQNVAYKQIGPWSDTLTSRAERKIRTKADGATASGFFRSDKMMQQDDKAKTVLKGNKDNTQTTVWTAFCDIVRDFDWLFWVLLGVMIEKMSMKSCSDDWPGDLWSVWLTIGMIMVTMVL